MRCKLYEVEKNAHVQSKGLQLKYNKENGFFRVLYVVYSFNRMRIHL